VQQHKTLTQDTTEYCYPNGPVPRIIRFFRADDPFDSGEVFVLTERKRWLLGRADGAAPEQVSLPRILIRSDAIMSASHALLSVGERGWMLGDAGSKNGTFVNGIRLREPVLLRDGDILECGQSFFIYRDRQAEVAYRARSSDHSGHFAIPPLNYQMGPVLPWVDSDSNLVIVGDAGSGKEVVARAIHALSGRSGPFVVCNCAESFELSEMPAAGGGTLFLDEIGELSLSMQGKLLQGLDDDASGASSDGCGFRLISASLYDPAACARSRQFREDLLARLGRICGLPPLREHKEELGHLIRFMVARRLGERLQHARSNPPISFTLKAARALVYYDWPYNIRELRQCLEIALASALSAETIDGYCTIELAHLPIAVREAHIGVGARARSPAQEVPVAAELARSEVPQRALLDEELLRALEEARGNRSRAARMLGVSERTVFRRLRRLRER
jgi:hypothetical protein